MGLNAASASRHVRMLRNFLATPTGDHLFCRASKNRVVPFVGRHLDLLDFDSGQNIEASISPFLQILGAVQCTHIGIII